MVFWRGVGVFVGVLVLFYVFVFFIGGVFVGDVVWEPSAVGDCSDVEVLALWDEVFVEGSSGVVVYKGFDGGVCNNFVAIKGDGVSEIRILVWDYSNDVSGTNITTWGHYFNATPEVYDGINLVSSLDSVGLYLLGLMFSIESGMNSWDVGDGVAAKSKFDGIFDVRSYDFELSDSDSYAFAVNESNSSFFEGYGGAVEKDVGVAFFLDGKSYYSGVVDNGPSASFVGDVPDFVFEANSSWNVAFDFRDYFDVSGDFGVGFDYVGVNNTNGMWINYSFDGDNARFMPAVGFVGSRDFRLVVTSDAGDVVSNNFSVEIRRENFAPVLVEDVPSFSIVPGGSFSIDLAGYFEDEDDLTYGVHDALGVNVSFVGSVMSVVAGASSVNDYARFKVYAFDGLVRTYSDYVSVFLGNGDGGDDDLNASYEDAGASGDVGNESGGVEVDTYGMGWVFWVVVGVVGLVFFGVVGIAVYYFVFREGGMVHGDDVRQVGTSAADDYVKGLKLKGE